MFSGIVEATGMLAEAKRVADGLRIRIRTDLTTELTVGDSLCVNGVCLTAILLEAGEVHADVGPETARITTLGAMGRDQRVNLERAVPLGGRLGGHLVLGHVDGVGTSSRSGRTPAAAGSPSAFRQSWRGISSARVR
jgi:riboflavin synthase